MAYAKCHRQQSNNYYGPEIPENKEILSIVSSRNTIKYLTIRTIYIINNVNIEHNYMNIKLGLQYAYLL